MHIVEVTEGKGALCAEILAALPQWFGIAESNAAYITDVETLPLFAARDGETTLGFLALKRHTPHACEILVMGVVPARHRQGAGRALIEAAAAYARANGARFVTVKTLSPAHSDPGYARTRAFYEGLGFLAIEEFPTLWGAENPALLLVKPLG
jgi:ribosomal protein S18 acetylase RimI-like enzyme